MSLNGFLIDIRTVSESNLEIEVDTSNITWDKYQALVEHLEDLLSYIDESHSAKSWLVKGRGIRAKYRRVTSTDRRRKLHFVPFPSKYVNILKNTRTQLYNLVAINCLVLESVGRRKVYLLPKHLAPFFIEAVERINMEVIEPLREGIKDFQQSDDYLKIQQCLCTYDIDPTILKMNHYSIGDFKVDVLPMDFGYSIDADEAYNKMKRGKATRGLEILKKQLDRKNKEYAVKAVSEVVTRITGLTTDLESGRRIRNAVHKIDKLMDICTSLELKDVNEKVLQPLRHIFAARKHKRQTLSGMIFGTQSIKAGVEKRLKTLLPTFWRWKKGKLK